MLRSQLRRDAALGSALPSFSTTAAHFNASIPLVNQTIAWNPITDTADWDGFALLVDDVERYVGTALNYSLASLQAGIPHFFRLAVSARVSSITAKRDVDHDDPQFTSDGTPGDFTMPATLWPNGTWVDPLPGPS